MEQHTKHYGLHHGASGIAHRRANLDCPGDDTDGHSSKVRTHRVVEAVVDPHEPPLPGNITMKQALKFAEPLLRGEQDGWEIIKNVVGDKIREVI